VGGGGVDADGVGVGVGVGVAAGGTGVATGDGVGEGVEFAETTVTETDAATTLFFGDLPCDTSARPTRVCLPSATAVGSAIRVLNLPDLVVVGVGSQDRDDPSQVSVTTLADGKPAPVAIRLLPGTGTPPTARVGAFWPVARKGTTSAGMSSSIGTVRSHSSQPGRGLEFAGLFRGSRGGNGWRALRGSDL
jgi:hypothetical protein